MDDWLREHEERQSALWDRLERLGVLAPVGVTIRIGAVEVEILKTFADCATTAILYRAPRMAMLHPHVSWPPEVTHRGGDGTMFRDVHVWRLAPVRSDRKSVRLELRPFDEEVEPGELEIPVNRSLTASFDRTLGERPDDQETNGVRIVVEDARAGLIRAWIDLRIEGTDANVLAVNLGDQFHGPRVSSGPGPAAMWREWFPQEGDEIQAEKVETPDGTVRASGSARAELTATPDPDPDRHPEPEPPSLPDPGWMVLTFPQKEPLAGQGGGSGGRPVGGVVSANCVLLCDPPPPEATALELVLSRLYAYRYAGGDAVIVPPPDRTRSVELTGLGFSWEGERLELVSWDVMPDGGYSLSARAPEDWDPDVRVLGDDSSVSLWSHRLGDGTLRLALPRIYNPLFERSSAVSLALRLVGKTIPEVRVRLPLRPPGR